MFSFTSGGGRMAQWLCSRCAKWGRFRLPHAMQNKLRANCVRIAARRPAALGPRRINETPEENPRCRRKRSARRVLHALRPCLTGGAC